MPWSMPRNIICGSTASNPIKFSNHGSLPNSMAPAVDPLSLQVFANLFASIAEEMGVTLQRTSFSPNIKMRRDFSCAVFDADGNLLAQAAHIPVHLGAMPMAMAAVRAKFNLGSGEVVILNDPFAGGTHLPDVSMVSA